MESKKGTFINTRNPPVADTIVNEAIPKHVHQHNTPPQHLRLLQYGLKLSNHQHTQLTHQHQPSTHQHQSSSIAPPLYHHHRPQSRESVTPNIYQNQVFHHQSYQYQQIPENQKDHIQSQTNRPPSQNYQQLHLDTSHAWVPHQLTEHYHPQQQLQQSQQPQLQKSDQVNVQHSSPTSQALKSKENERKKSTSRFPTSKRASEAPVTIQGWLHKQGSDGLMLWKKRWFVLSEYCLFYYKGPDEEKVLGSILLPSYKVSICGHDDKVNRKYAFKCEHANMRTYVFAADSQELMMQWVRVLSLASLLQSSNSSEPGTRQSSTYNQSVEACSVKMVSNSRNIPTHMHTSSNTTDFSNLSQQELNQFSQPLYANAPPKPKRLTDGYVSPSSEVLDRFGGDPKYASFPEGQHYTFQPTYIPLNDATTKSINIYNNPQAHPEYICRSIQHQINAKQIQISENSGANHHNVERRTPDTYGRSKLNQSKSIYSSDYEDVYADQTMYKRPLSPVAYNNQNNRLNSVPIMKPYTHIAVHGSKGNLPYILQEQIQHKISNTIPRPHSADFLEYEIKQENSNMIRKNRPKSSLDINRHTTNDNYFYSEERYAEKMRKSAQYLPKMSKLPGHIDHSRDRQRWNHSINKSDSETVYPVARVCNRPVYLNEVYQELCSRDVQPVRSRSVLSDGSLSKEVDMETHYIVQGDFEKKAAFGNHQELYIPNEDDQRSRDYDQFKRSASARLTQYSAQEEKALNRDGERKREESMKRLLEWKQRMLQSPLNRKANQGRSKRAYYKTNDNGYPISATDVYSENKDSVTVISQYNSYSSDDEASGSTSIPGTNLRIPSRRPIQSKSTTNINGEFLRPQQGCYIFQAPSHHDLSSDTSLSSNSRKVNWKLGDKMNAGELLGRTHEELVLLLIQLRRQNANTCNAIEVYYNEIDNIQTRLPTMDASKRLENLQKLEQIKQHLLELEKQYEKGKPLVNLVDNMVKLGSLYRFPKDNKNYPHVRDRLVFNQHIQERRLLAEERRDWNRLSPTQTELNTKVQQLYQLDKLIQDESETLQSLQQDKEEIERTLCGLRNRLIKGFKDPIEIEQARKQQILLENELSRVHSMLAQNSRKLEETVAGNARLEQELLVLKQKLQLSKHQRSSPQISNAGDSLPCVIGTSAMLESDLHRVQQKVGDLQRQRLELSAQVKQLTDRSNNLQQLRLSSMSAHASQGNKKKMTSLWRETDLDTMKFIDHGESCDVTPQSNNILPLYINTNSKHIPESDFSTSSFQSIDSTSDDNQNQNIIPQEKQEIKTVRIVKRESERRQRDRDKGNCGGRWDVVTEEEDLSQSPNDLFKQAYIQKTQSTVTLDSTLSTNLECDKYSSGILSRQSSLSQPSLPQTYSDIKTALNVSTDKISELSPIFKSESAKQIIMEMSTPDAPKHMNRRIIPKEKRRHYTAPHNNLIMKSLHQLPTDNKDFDKVDIRRARDDLDMERALRQRIDAPDVVRSTLSNKELKYNESTIDNILGTPNKIIIPERYVPEQLPQLTAEEQQHRLKKVESIKKMLSDTTIISGSSPNLLSEETNTENSTNVGPSKTTSKIIEEKKQREHLLQLNQILAKQVMEMSKIVAGSGNPGE